MSFPDDPSGAGTPPGQPVPPHSDPDEASAWSPDGDPAGSEHASSGDPGSAEPAVTVEASSTTLIPVSADHEPPLAAAAGAPPKPPRPPDPPKDGDDEEEGMAQMSFLEHLE